MATSAATLTRARTTCRHGSRRSTTTEVPFTPFSVPRPVVVQICARQRRPARGERGTHGVPCGGQRGRADHIERISGMCCPVPSVVLGQKVYVFLGMESTAG